MLHNDVRLIQRLAGAVEHLFWVFQIDVDFRHPEVRGSSALVGEEAVLVVDGLVELVLGLCEMAQGRRHGGQGVRGRVESELAIVLVSVVVNLAGLLQTTRAVLLVENVNGLVRPRLVEQPLRIVVVRTCNLSSHHIVAPALGVWLKQTTFRRIEIGCESHETAANVAVHQHNALHGIVDGIGVRQVAENVPQVVLQDVFRRVQRALDENGLHHQLTLSPLLQLFLYNQVRMVVLNTRQQLYQHGSDGDNQQSSAFRFRQQLFFL